jgi:predicted RNA binding protein YcfA (HicA-like mRNA interferase family)
MVHARRGRERLSHRKMSEFPRWIIARRLIQALRADGFRAARIRGSHHLYRHEDGRRVIVAHHSFGDTFPIGTLKAMLVDIGWTEADLRRLGVSS